MDGITKISLSDIQECFMKTLPSILREKKEEFADLDYERCRVIDACKDREDFKVCLTFFDISSGYTQLNKEIKKMTRMMGIGGRKHRREISGIVLPKEEAKQVPILDICEFKKIKKTGRRTMVSCPFHDDNSPSMIINSNNTWKCFSCQESGDSIELVMKLYGYSFISAVRHLIRVKNEII